MDLQAALAVARMCKQPPGKAKANEYLKLCREGMRMVGEQVDVEEQIPEFHWRAYLAYHPKANEIFKSPVLSFFAEAFPEVDPNASKLVNSFRPNCRRVQCEANCSAQGWAGALGRDLVVALRSFRWSRC